MEEKEQDKEAKWYVVHTYSGYENKVKANIDKTIENRHLEDQILEVLQAKSLYTDVILTGRDSLPRVFDMADNILNIVPEKV